MSSASPLTYVDQIMAMQSMMAIQKVFEKGDFSLKNILLMFIMLCFDGIRKYFLKAFEQLDVLPWITTKYQSLSIKLGSKRRRSMVEAVHDTRVPEYAPSITLNFEPSLTFWQSILDTSSNSSNSPNASKATVSYTTTSDKIFKQTNMFEYTLHETYTNVAIVGQDFEAYFQDSLNVVTSHVNGHTTIKSITSTGAQGTQRGFRDHPDVTCFSDMIPFPAFAKEFKRYVLEKQSDQIANADSMMMTYKQNEPDKNECTFVYASVFKFKSDDIVLNIRGSNGYNIRESSPLIDIYGAMLPTLLKKYKNWNVVLGLYELYYILCIVSEHLITTYDKLRASGNDSKYRDIFVAKGNTVFGCDISLAFQKFQDFWVGRFVMSAYVNAVYLSYLPQYKEVYYYLHKLFYNAYDDPKMTNTKSSPNTTAIANSNTTTKETTNSNSVTLYGNLQSWIAYVQDLSTNTRVASAQTTTTESQVYILKVADDIITEEVPNPAYTEWETYMDKLQKIGQSGVGAAANAPPLPPSKTITNTKIVKKVVTEHINAIHKDMSNLYLRREDKRKLLSCLTQYHQNKALLKELGIPNKLGIMLYGEPGTGKSSTISAIASFLNKNIYYVQMNDVKSNAELMMLFTHVTKNCANSGIIVMEDIDAMTKVVHKRTGTEITDADTNNSNKDDTLTLEFFLNILQGSLTADDTIFITTTNHIECLDPAFYRDGRFDVKIEMRAANHYQIDCIYERFFKRPIDPKVLTRIPEFKYTPATFIARFREFLLEPNTDDNEILSIFMEQQASD